MRSAVIKPRATPQAVPAPLELRDVEHERDALLAAAQAERAAAREEAEAIVAQAAADARERIGSAMALARRGGYERGLEQGLKDGRARGEAAALAEARAQFATDSAGATALLEALVQEWRGRHRQLFAEARRDVAALAIAIVRRIAPRFVELDASIAEGSCAAALEMLGSAHEAVVRVNPDDRAVLEHLWQERGGAGGAASIRWVEDREIARGGVRVETAQSAIDARLSTQIDRIADDLVDDWARRVAMMEQPGG